MSHHFYLSYARADRSPLVKRFFDDLCDTIRIRSGLPRSDVVGFYEEPENRPRLEWSAESDAALRNSHTMVSLLSPAYFHGEHAGKEWQVFEMLRLKSFKNSGTEGKRSESLPEIITPVIWIPWQGPIPRVINEMLSHPGCIYQRRAVTTMFRSADRSLAEYAELVKLLANKIVEVVHGTSLPPSDPLPPMKDVHNPFHIWDEPLVISNGRLNQSDRYRRPRIDGEFVNTLAAQIVDLAGKGNSPVAPAVSDDVRDRNFEQDKLGFGSTNGPKPEKKYSVVVIDNEEQVLGLIEECCLISGLFDVRTYNDAETAFRDLRLRSFYGDERPDLFLIDLGEDMKGLEVINELQDKIKPTPSIIALSGFASNDIDATAEAGAVAIIAKPLNTADLIDQMVRCAEIGSKSPVDPTDGAAALPPDYSRKRPVFLSFCKEDIRRANFLKRNLEARGIGVWFSPDAEEPGEVWRNRIRDGLSEARVFVALFTDNYEKSKVCVAELTDLWRRLGKRESEQQPPLLIPVLYNFEPAVLEDKLIKDCIKKYHYITISSGKFLPGFTTLLGRIQNVVNRNPYPSN